MMAHRRPMTTTRDCYVTPTPTTAGRGVAHVAPTTTSHELPPCIARRFDRATTTARDFRACYSTPTTAPLFRIVEK